LEYETPLDAPPRLPILLEVSGPSGLIAQEAFTIVEHYAAPEGGGSYKVHDITECERQHLDIYAENGEVFCNKHFEVSPGALTWSIEMGGW